MKIVKKNYILFIILGLLVAIVANKLYFRSQEKSSLRKRVLISQVIEHPALNQTVRGIIDALKEGGYEKDKNLEIRVESAQANGALAAQIAEKFMAQEPDVVVGVGTLSAQSLVKYAINNQTKLIFSSITDPSGAGLVQEIEKPGNNTSGVSNFVNLEPQLTMFKKLLPKLKRIGILYNVGEVNSVSMVKKLEILCPQLGLSLVKQTIAKTGDVAQGALKLAAQVDAIFISNDNTSLSSLPSIINVAEKAKIPVFVSDVDATEKGAVAALGPNQYNIGHQTGRMIVGILNGDDIKAMPVQFPAKIDLYINLDAAKKIGLAIPQEILDNATKIINTPKE